MFDRIGYTCVFSYALISEIDLTVLVYGDVFQESVSLDGVIDIGFGFLVKVDYLGVAATLEVEDSVVVPAVLVIADEESLGISCRFRKVRKR